MKGDNKLKRYELVIFDLDGTLADTSIGIYNCHRYTAVQMGMSEPSDAQLKGVIGGPLLETYKKRFNFNEQQARTAVEIYRRRYSEQGIYEAKIYEGIPELLEMLKDKGVKLAVATLKKEEFAKIILNDLRIANYFDLIRGVDGADSLSKEDLIRSCIENIDIAASKSVLIGDSMYDAIGAQSCGIDFIGVTYGFGLHDKEDANEYPVLSVCNNIKELFDHLNNLL